MDRQQQHQQSFTTDGQRLNLSGALQRLRGDRGLLLDLIQFYLEDYPQVVGELRRAAEDHNREELLRAAHSLKGLAANFDAQEVIDTANTIEQNAKTGNLFAAAALVPRLDLALYRLSVDLCNYREAQAS